MAVLTVHREGPGPYYKITMSEDVPGAGFIILSNTMNLRQLNALFNRLRDLREEAIFRGGNVGSWGDGD